MDTLTAFDALTEKVERIVEKYEEAARDRDALRQQLDSQKNEYEDMKRRIEEFATERTAVRQKIDEVLHKIEQLGI